MYGPLALFSPFCRSTLSLPARPTRLRGRRARSGQMFSETHGQRPSGVFSTGPRLARGIFTGHDPLIELVRPRALSAAWTTTLRGVLHGAPTRSALLHGPRLVDRGLFASRSLRMDRLGHQGGVSVSKPAAASAGVPAPAGSSGEVCVSKPAFGASLPDCASCAAPPAAAPPGYSALAGSPAKVVAVETPFVWWRGLALLLKQRRRIVRDRSCW